MNNSNTKKLVTTAVIIALTVVFQNLRLVIGTDMVATYIIGTLVNLCLIVAAVHVGLVSGLAVAVIAPLVALLQGFAQPVMVAWIILGNAVLAVLFALTARKIESKAAYLTVGAVAAVLKFSVIALGMTWMVTGKNAFMPGLTVAIERQLQQLITAAVAAVVALPVLGALKRAKV
jgi:Protein of unknown function (DUF1393).